MDSFENDSESDASASSFECEEELGERKETEIFRTSYRPQASSVERRTSTHLWLISYSDFMTILMIFFLGMYGYTVLAKAAYLKSQTPAQMTADEFSSVVEHLKSQLGQGVELKNDANKIVLKLPNEILFPSGKANLNERARGTLEEFGNSLKLMDGDIVVEGHTDNVPIVGGAFVSNWELSAARAFSVIEVLTKSGIPPERLAAWGFGENRSLVPNLDEEGRAKNRRIEIILLKKPTEKKEAS